ncbi:hypothetical protein TNCV_3843301 [Trichonephila clavipes]|nr:hypothetical protein TNCV_3843301 [Trichonephila clavipes]
MRAPRSDTSFFRESGCEAPPAKRLIFLGSPSEVPSAKRTRKTAKSAESVFGPTNSPDSSLRSAYSTLGIQIEISLDSRLSVAEPTLDKLKDSPPLFEGFKQTESIKSLDYREDIQVLSTEGMRILKKSITDGFSKN